MNKMTKGALATGLGIALLIGGGGTLAVWNASVQKGAGPIASGNLDITAVDGMWKDTNGEAITISDYKIVPGEELIFTQPVKVDLEGAQMKATLALTDPTINNDHLQVSSIALTKEGSEFAETVLDADDSGEYIATVTVSFSENTQHRDGAGVEAGLSALGFKLEQVAPIPSAAASTLP